MDMRENVCIESEQALESGSGTSIRRFWSVKDAMAYRLALKTASKCLRCSARCSWTWSRSVMSRRMTKETLRTAVHVAASCRADLKGICGPS